MNATIPEVLAGHDFRAVGIYEPRPGRPGGLVIVGEPRPETEGCYAFIVDGVCMYIGHARRLLHRTNKYREAATGGAAAVAMRAAIAAGKTVVLAIAPDLETLTIAGTTMSIARSLEGALIERLQPAWNCMGCDRPDIREARIAATYRAIATKRAKLTGDPPGRELLN